LKDAPNVLDKDEYNNRQKRFIGKKLFKLHLTLFVDLYEELKSKNGSPLHLSPMGRIFHFEEIVNENSNRRNDDIFYYQMREIKDKNFFKEVVLLENCFRHHYPHIYEEMLSAKKIKYYSL